MTAWTQILHTELAKQAVQCINKNNLRYHNLEHVQSMYQYLHDTGEPYDAALDWAVLFHDVVYDAHKSKERRSADLFVSMYSASNEVSGVDQDRVYALIMATADHRVTDVLNSSAIIRADLHNFLKPLTAIASYVAIMEESMQLYNCTEAQFAEASESVMATLQESVLLNYFVDEAYSHIYSRIVDGIEIVNSISRSIQGSAYAGAT